MGVKVATNYLNWSQSVPHSPSFPQTLASAISSPSSKRRSLTNVAIVCRYMESRSAFLGTKLYRSRSFELPKCKPQSIKRACSASLDSFSDEEFSKKIEELALSFQLSEDDVDENAGDLIETESFSSNSRLDAQSMRSINSIHSPFSKMEELEPPDWPGEISIERKANSMELPVSLRMIKRKKQWQEGFREAGESAYCSVKKAFSSMVFIIRELQSYTLQMREVLFYEDLQGILVRVQQEMNASFVWLFQQVFSHTPTLMVYVMILLANYSVYSMGVNTAIAATPPAYAATIESVSTIETHDQGVNKFDSSTVKRFSVSSSGKTTSVGGINGGGGKFPSIASGMDGDGRFDGSISSDFQQTIVPDGGPSRASEESISGQVNREDETQLWNSMLEEASNMQSVTRDESLDLETMQKFVSPVTVRIETEDFEDYFRTELLYQTGLTQEPNSSLLLANYAQFLYVVAHDYDRAEDYFQKAVKAEPKDAEAVSKYANFLWRAKKDLWAAEETFLEAISIDPSNSHYAANYAHFLWSTGGEDTCYPLSSPETTNEI